MRPGEGRLCRILLCAAGNAVPRVRLAGRSSYSYLASGYLGRSPYRVMAWQPALGARRLAAVLLLLVALGLCPPAASAERIYWSQAPAFQNDGNAGIEWTNYVQGGANGNNGLMPSYACGGLPIDPTVSSDQEDLVFANPSASTEGGQGLHLVDLWDITPGTCGVNFLDTAVSGGEAREPSFRPPGRSTVVFAYRPSGQTDFDLYTVGTDGTGLSSVIQWPGDQRLPAYSPDGQTIAFNSGKGPSGQSVNSNTLWIVHADGSNPAQDGVCPRPQWSQDGQSVVCSGPTTGVFTLGLKSGAKSQVAPASQNPTAAVWSADGLHVYYIGKSNGVLSDESIFRVDVYGAVNTDILSIVPRGAHGLSLAVATPSTTTVEPRRDGWLRKFAPTLHFSQHETYFADSAAEATDYYSATGSNRLGDAGGRQIASAAPGSNPQLNLDFLGSSYTNGDTAQPTDRIVEASDYQTAADSLHANGYGNQMYGRALQENGHWWLQYWFYYYYNPQSALFDTGAHEGDWEMVQFQVSDAGELGPATFGRHSDTDAESCSSYDTVSSAGSISPQVYVANGGHGNYRAPGSYNRGGFLPSDEADGQGMVTRPQVDVVTSGLPRWILWPGLWGNSSDVIRGPGGHLAWQDPDAFNAQATPCAVSGSTGASAARRRTRGAIRAPSVTAAAAPNLRAHVRGRQVEVDYTIRGSTESLRSKGLFVTVHPTGRRFAPTGKLYPLAAQHGVVKVALPLGHGPYTAVASTVDREGRYGKTARVRIAS
jgi:hypothetical protein